MKRLLPFTGVAVVAAAAFLASSVAVAQPYGPPPPPPGQGGQGGYGQPGPGYGPPPGPPPRRIGFGGSIGLGSMDNEYGDISCDGCSTSPIAFGLAGYFGFFINPQLMLMAEVDGTFQRLDVLGANWLAQSSLILGARFNVNPQLYLKGGLGWSGLSILYDDGGPDEELSNGGALMMGIGYEFLRNYNFAMDASFKFIAGHYEDLDDSIYTGTINLGISWYL